jgi:hypothetical protein
MSSSSVRNIPALTGIRAVAALLVLSLHCDQSLPIGLSAILPPVARGYLGVDLFFILSGFIITHVYVKSLARPKIGAVCVFLWHRFVRLYPIHLAALAGLAAIVGAATSFGVRLNNPQAWSPVEMGWQLTLLHAWGVTNVVGWNTPSWSISAEWFAYLLFPLLAPILACIDRSTTALLIAGGALLGGALYFLLAGVPLNSWTGLPAIVRVSSEFLCGAAFCRAVNLAPVKGGGDAFGGAAFLVFFCRDVDRCSRSLVDSPARSRDCWGGNIQTMVGDPLWQQTALVSGRDLLLALHGAFPNSDCHSTLMVAPRLCGVELGWAHFSVCRDYYGDSGHRGRRLFPHRTPSAYAIQKSIRPGGTCLVRGCATDSSQ